MNQIGAIIFFLVFGILFLISAGVEEYNGNEGFSVVAYVCSLVCFSATGYFVFGG